MAACGRNFVGDDDKNLPRFNHFIKELCPEAILTKKLMFPQKFVKTVKKDLSHEVRLEVPNSRVWIVGLTRERANRNIAWLDSGFGEFLSFYSIGARHSLIFKYRGGSHFEVVVCDNTACEVAYPTDELPASSGEGDDSNDDESDDEEEEDEDDEDYLLGGLNFRNGKGKQVEAENRRSGDASGSRRGLPRETERAAGAASAGQRNRGKEPCPAGKDSDSSADSLSDEHRPAAKMKRADIGNGASGSRQKFPNTATRPPQVAARGRYMNLLNRLRASNITTMSRFHGSIMELSSESVRAVEKAIDFDSPEIPSVLVVMRRFHIRECKMHLPAEFALKYIPEDPVMVSLRACCEGMQGFLNESLILAERDDQNSLAFKGKWREFRANNDLLEGDVCLLRLVDAKDKIFNVYIFRA